MGAHAAGIISDAMTLLIKMAEKGIMSLVVKYTSIFPDAYLMNLY